MMRIHNYTLLLFDFIFGWKSCYLHFIVLEHIDADIIFELFAFWWDHEGVNVVLFNKNFCLIDKIKL